MNSISQTAFVFDLDGTLIDSKPSIVFGIQSLQKQLQIKQSTTADVRYLIGLPLPDMFDKLGIGTSNYEELRQVYSNAMFSHMRHHMSAFPTVVDTLKSLKNSNVPLAIVTSRGRDSYQPCLKIAGIDPDFFAASVCREDCEKHKPDPEPLFTLARSTGWSVQQMIYVGDAVVDMECALSAGSKAIFASYDADQELSTEIEAKVFAQISSFDEIMRFRSK